MLQFERVVYITRWPPQGRGCFAGVAWKKGIVGVLDEKFNSLGWIENARCCM